MTIRPIHEFGDGQDAELRLREALEHALRVADAGGFWMARALLAHALTLDSTFDRVMRAQPPPLLSPLDPPDA